VEVKGLRGIREGKLTDLSPLVVLVGPNGSGKSTVLEGLLIGARPDTTAAIIQVILRHQSGGTGPRWLLWKGGTGGSTEIEVMTDSMQSRRVLLELERGLPIEETRIRHRVLRGEDKIADGWVGGAKNRFQNYDSSGFQPLPDLSEVQLVEAYPTSFQQPLHELYTKAVQNGRRREAIGIISEVFPSVTSIEILTEHGEPILHFVFPEYSVPASLAGDGIQSLLRLSLELAASGGGVALLEEPEVHQHPGAIRQSARAILAAVRRQIQVVLTTHSLELIDALLAASLDQDLDNLNLYRLQLQNGTLKYSRLPGRDIAFARTEIEDDLR
jgi:energy-coupling factor transporter ATP-binding protein EcfA2